MVKRFLVVVAALLTAATAAAADNVGKLDSALRQRATARRGHSRVIVRLDPGASAETAIRDLRGTVGRRLVSVGAQVADVPDAALDALASVAGVSRISLDRRVQGTLERTGATIGATWVHDTLGFDGTGVGVAIVDSGVANWHDDLGSDRVAGFVDFVNFQPAAYDDYGHGTHVAGIVAGSGFDSGGRRRGIAPGATLLVEKVLDASGQGYISNVISAIDYAIANKDALHLRVINLSVAAGVYESFDSDPLTLAARRAVDAGLVVVSAAGNLGRTADGSPQYGGIGAPGNAPWVITVGASSHNGTVTRSDDTVAGFSSRGPSAIDFQAKPDIVAPGVGIESLGEAGTTLYDTKPSMRLWGTVPTATEPYLSLSGTSMASPVVSATIALMLQANSALTPNLVKAILEFTAETHAEYDGLTEGAGFLNARGAVELARAMANGLPLDAGSVRDDPTPWGGRVIWGNQRLGAGALGARAWAVGVRWGAAAVRGTSAGSDAENVVWGAACLGADCAGVIWGAACDTGCGRIVWGNSDGDGDDIVWSTNVLGSADEVVWGPVRRRRSPWRAAGAPVGDPTGTSETPSTGAGPR